MELEEAKRIINDFIMYCRFNEKRKYNDEQLFKAMEYFAYNDFIPKKKIEDKIKYWEELMHDYCKRKEYDQVDIATYKIKILQELLEDK